MRRIALGILMLSIVAGAATAQMTETTAAWGRGPAKFLMTPQDEAAWKAVKSDAEAQKFIDLFWARRDPTPATPRNEFREEFDARIAAADQFFTTRKMKGSMSDRGRTVILLGSPFLVGGLGAESGASGTNQGLSADGSITVGAARAAGAKVSWTYSGDKKPKFIKRKDFVILFSDESGNGDYEFAVTPRNNPNVLLTEAVNAYLLWPKLESVPTYGGVAVAAAPAKPTAFRDAALKMAYEKFKTEQKAIGTAHLTWGEYVTPEGQAFVPVSLFVPQSANIPAGRKVTFFGVVENAAGEVVEILEEEATLVASGRDAYVDRTIILEPGQYKAAFGVAEDGQALTLTPAELSVQGLKAGEPAVSQLILSNNAFPLPEAQKRTDPFAFGGLKVVPKGDAVFATADELWYFMEMRHPGLDEAGAPKVMVKLDINGTTAAGKPSKMNFPISSIDPVALKGVANHFALVQAIPLTDVQPGQYTLKVKFIDTVLKKTYEAEAKFEVRKL